MPTLYKRQCDYDGKLWFVVNYEYHHHDQLYDGCAAQVEAIVYLEDGHDRRLVRMAWADWEVLKETLPIIDVVTGEPAPPMPNLFDAGRGKRGFPRKGPKQ